MNQSVPTASNATTSSWFCVRSKPKHEHIAAAHLRQVMEPLDVFCPRLRIRRRTRRGAVWFIEALFPGYLFARFDPNFAMQIVKSTPGVTTIVSFGLITPTIRDEVIEELRADFDQNELYEVGDDIRPGDEITIATGPFQGLKASVLRVLSPADRVQVLLDILGGVTSVEIGREQVMTQKMVDRLAPPKTVRTKEKQ